MVSGNRTSLLSYMINAALITAGMWFFFFVILGTGGGATALFKFGSSLSKLFTALPWWANVGVGVFLLWLFFGGRK